MLSTWSRRFLVSLAFLNGVGCAAEQRRMAGGTVAAVGGLTMLAGVVVTAGCIEENDPHTSSCERSNVDPHPEVGVPMIGAGLVVLAIGGALYGTGVVDPPSTTSTPPNPSSPAYPYDY
jgi:hypothetical protein